MMKEIKIACLLLLFVGCATKQDVEDSIRFTSEFRDDLAALECKVDYSICLNEKNLKITCLDKYTKCLEDIFYYTNWPREVIY